MTWEGHAARVGNKRDAYRILVVNPERKTSIETFRRRGRITLRWILENWDGVIWAGSIWFRIGTSGKLL
jgi:hypothetical protein